MALRYNESELVHRLSELTPQQRTAFAALVAERLVSAGTGIETHDGRSLQSVLTTALDHVWRALISGSKSESDQQQIEICTNLFPADPEVPSETDPLAEDAISAVIYTLRSQLHGSEQDAAWAARRGYEAVDRYVIDKEGYHTGGHDAEQQIANSPRVQLELLRQVEDLQELKKLGSNISDDTYKRLRSKARANANTFLRR
jgi:uncharacterized protein YjaG (DUF416 family)